MCLVESKDVMWCDAWHSGMLQQRDGSASLINLANGGVLLGLCTVVEVQRLSHEFHPTHHVKWRSA